VVFILVARGLCEAGTFCSRQVFTLFRFLHVLTISSSHIWLVNCLVW